MRLNIGSGFTRIKGFTNIDCVPCIDDKGEQFSDVICNIEKEKLPYMDNSVDEIVCYEVLEHLDNLILP
jgi:predicted SAM-dependent methyltransferase